jgi:hypothetical protein
VVLQSIGLWTIGIGNSSFHCILLVYRFIDFYRIGLLVALQSLDSTFIDF